MEKEDQSLVPKGEGQLSGGPVLIIVVSIGMDSKCAWVAPVRNAVRNETRGRLADCFCWMLIATRGGKFRAVV